MVAVREVSRTVSCYLTILYSMTSLSLSVLKLDPAATFCLRPCCFFAGSGARGAITIGVGSEHKAS